MKYKCFLCGIPKARKTCKIFWVILSLFANFEAERAQNGPKKLKIFFSNVNQNKLYFPIPVSDQQVVEIVSPYCP
jgi:hypothetical protein